MKKIETKYSKCDEFIKMVKSTFNKINATQVQILDETDSISHSTNTLGKGMNLIILLPAMGK